MLNRRSPSSRPHRSYGRQEVLLPTGTEAMELDRRAIETSGIPSRLLMENAGRSAALLLDRLYPSGRVLVLVGSGNNGGDGVVLARTLSRQGRKVEILLVGSRPAPDPLLHGWNLTTHRMPEEAGELDTFLASFDLLVDALLGTGARGAPREPSSKVIAAANQSGKPILALDLPSGVEADTGAILDVAVKADVTVAFGHPKVGSLLFPGRGVGGRLIAIEIGFPPPVPGDAGAALITSGWAERSRPQRRLVTHKKAEGRVLILAGSEGMAGAAVLAARGALRAGAGYVRVASALTNREILQRSVPEAIVLNAEDREAIEEAARDSDALLIGPGIGLDAAGAERVNLLLSVEGPNGLLLDADALTLLAEGRLSAFPGRLPAVRRLLTPHPGEMARLQRGGSDAVPDSILAAARMGAERWSSVLLLKGAPSLVASPGEGPVRVSTTGSSDLARAGMGDLLGGVAVAFMARGLDAADAASLALHYTGRAAALTGKGEGLLPSDIAESLSGAMDEAAEESDLGFPFVTLDLDPPH